jgi:hypothetical protein
MVEGASRGEVLVVEVDDADRERLGSTLEGAGFEVGFAPFPPSRASPCFVP